MEKHLSMAVQPLGQFRQRFAAVRNLVLGRLVHLGVCLPLVLEAGVPSWKKESCQQNGPAPRRTTTSTSGFTDRNLLVRELERSCPGYNVSGRFIRSRREKVGDRTSVLP